VNKNRDTALLYCCKNEIYKPIQSLISICDINVNIKEDRGRTAATYLAEKSRDAELKKIMYKSCDFSYFITFIDKSHLHASLFFSLQAMTKTSLSFQILNTSS